MNDESVEPANPGSITRGIVQGVAKLAVQVYRCTVPQREREARERGERETRPLQGLGPPHPQTPGHVGGGGQVAFGNRLFWWTQLLLECLFPYPRFLQDATQNLLHYFLENATVRGRAGTNVWTRRYLPRT
jgi:hypothetical protein